jgi:predicted ATPase/DNA-binding transcriptional LysR family regulator
MDVEARLRAFAAVAREGSFSRAAERLYVSQPAVSKHVASLEAELGAQLITRDRRGATLTPAGQVLADYVLRAEALLANARRALATGAEAQIGTLSIAASGIPGTYLLPGLLSRFHEDHPAVELDVRLSTSGGALELVRSHEVELGVVGGMTVPAELESEPLVEDEVVLVGPPALGGRRLRPKELEGLTWVSREEGSATRAAVDASRWQIGLHAVKTLELPSWEAVKLAVANGAGIAAISRFALELELEAGRLAVLDVPRWRMSRTISVVTARDVPLTPPAERFLGLLRDAFPAEAGEPPPNSNLPELASAIVGREQEVGELEELLRGPTRLVTLTGTGGSGKTRLALEAASRLVDEFRDGVYLVELAPVREPELVLPEVARTVQARDAAELPERLRERRLLLVLDNFEQVLAAAPSVAELLASAPGLTVLVTSRAPLRVGGEQAYAVEPLSLEHAVRLFVRRARELHPRFDADESVAEVCERLDRLPLALELAAARVRTLPPAVLNERLERALPLLVGGRRDAPARQRTLRATIDWSCDLLADPERSLFPRLAVFGGGWALTDAEEICDADAPALESLVDQGLVQAQPNGTARFGMLETVRELAAELLERDPAAAQGLRRRHAERFLALAEEARAFARGPKEREWLDRLELELDNIRAALRYCISVGDPRLGLTLAEALEPLWVRGLHHREGVRWFEELFALEGDVPDAVRAGAVGIAARLTVELGNPRKAKPWYRRSLELARAAGDDARAAWALHGLGDVAFKQDRLAEARRRFEESLELFLAAGEDAPAGGRLTFLAAVAQRQGDLAAARSYLERARERYGAAGDAGGVAAAIHSLGDLALEEGDYDAALGYYGEALETGRAAATSWDLAYYLGGIAAACAGSGRPAEAARLWAAMGRLDADLEVKVDRSLYEQVLGDLDPRELAAGADLATSEAIALARKLSRAAGLTTNRASG